MVLEPDQVEPQPDLMVILGSDLREAPGLDLVVPGSVLKLVLDSDLEVVLASWEVEVSVGNVEEDGDELEAACVW